MAQGSTIGGFSMILVALIALAILVWSYNAFASGARSANAGNNRSIDSNAVDNAALAQAMKSDELAQDNARAVNEQMAADDAASNGNAGANAVAGMGDVMPAPLGYTPYAFTDDDAYFADYPNGIKGNSTMGDGQPSAYDLNLSSLMPASWRGSQDCNGAGAGIDDDVSGWSRYAPSKESFNNYVTAAGSARLGLSTRVRNPTGGISNLLRQAPPTVLSGTNVVFNDSGFRQDMVFNNLGFYPSQVQC